MNWRIVVGIIIIIGCISEFLHVVKEYSVGEIPPWPVGVEIACGLVIFGRFYLVRKGMQQKGDYTNNK